MIQRGKEPNKGRWSLPGGRIELGEAMLPAAMRELREETGLEGDSLYWYSEGPFTATDAVFHSYGGGHPTVSNMEVEFHYVVNQCFAELQGDGDAVSGTGVLVADDDAMDAQWWSLGEVERGCDAGTVSGHVAWVLHRAERLRAAQLLEVQAVHPDDIVNLHKCIND